MSFTLWIGTLISVVALVTPNQMALPVDTWVKAESRHFTVIADTDEGDAVAVARRFERLRGVFGRLWPTARLDARRVVILATSSTTRLRSLLPPAWSDPSATHPAGLTVTGLDRVYLAVPTTDDLPFSSVVTHEYVHLLIDANLPQAPLWLNEGLAEFFATGQFDSSVATFGLPNPAHLDTLRQRPWMSLSDLLVLDRLAPRYVDAKTSPVVYAEAWALVHFLKLGDGSRRASWLTTYTALLTRGVEPKSAAVEAFGDLKALERELRAYVRRDTFYDARLPRLGRDEVEAVASGRMPPWEASLILGDFLTHTDHYEEASRLLALAATLGSPTPEVWERQALLALLRRDLGAVADATHRALTLDAARPLAHYLRAMALLGSADGLTTSRVRDAEASLRRALAGSPTFAPAYSALGGLLAARDGASPEALALIQRAIALDPSVVAHQVALGQAMLLSGDLAEAQRIAERARAAARTANERETVERLLKAALATPR